MRGSCSRSSLLITAGARCRGAALLRRRRARSRSAPAGTRAWRQTRHADARRGGDHAERRVHAATSPTSCTYGVAVPAAATVALVGDSTPGTGGAAMDARREAQALAGGRVRAPALPVLALRRRRRPRRARGLRGLQPAAWSPGWPRARRSRRSSSPTTRGCRWRSRRAAWVYGAHGGHAGPCRRCRPSVAARVRAPRPADGRATRARLRAPRGRARRAPRSRVRDPRAAARSWPTPAAAAGACELARCARHRPHARPSATAATCFPVSAACSCTRTWTT